VVVERLKLARFTAIEVTHGTLRQEAGTDVAGVVVTAAVRTSRQE
jgi:hypothetical protein